MGPIRFNPRTVIDRRGRRVVRIVIRLPPTLRALRILELPLLLDDVIRTPAGGIFDASFLASDALIRVALLVSQVRLFVLHVAHRLVVRSLDVSLSPLHALGACAYEAKARGEAGQIQHAFHDRCSSLLNTWKVNVLAHGMMHSW